MSARHIPRHITLKHAHDAQHGGINQAIAIALNNHVGTMACAYLFVVIALVGLFGVLNILPPLVYLLVAWGSQTFIQLVMLPVIMVSQNVLGKHAEMPSDARNLAAPRSAKRDEKGRCRRQNRALVARRPASCHTTSADLSHDIGGPVTRHRRTCHRKAAFRERRI